ncbi:Oidioi.mRNA.OKI2018_I69.PAR.g11953.t1.cds [Oikopleura dioica]|uniref:Oidioi.mRNA.OKI2018_I69.PAR.g11953.t1.cds n=1 Tax=Oikopleura dioica TaxID=34765 RepID=A0ABN7RYN0_OIKDI|nr:Oidioi.mRNA.OKI2018_I69.PAR.g11953.t1.cds [Oikopleura dioica]
MSGYTNSSADSRQLNLSTSQAAVDGENEALLARAHIGRNTEPGPTQRNNNYDNHATDMDADEIRRVQLSSDANAENNNTT